MGASSTLVELDFDESVRLEWAVNAACLEVPEDLLLAETGVSERAASRLADLLRELPRAGGEDAVCLGGDPSQEPCDATARVRAGAGLVSLRLSPLAARRLRAVVEAGFTGSRAGYFMSHGLSRPAVRRVLAALTRPGPATTSLALAWGDQWLDAPPRALPPRGWWAGTVHLVACRRPRDGVDGFAVLSAWPTSLEADQEARRLAGAANGAAAPRHTVHLAGLAKKAGDTTGEAAGGGEGTDVFLVGCVTGEGTDDAELVPGTIWWDPDTAQREADRWNNEKPPGTTTTYRIWPTRLHE